MKRKNFAILITCGVLLLVLITTAAAIRLDVQMSWNVISGGGGTVQAGDIQLRHTIGQTLTGSARGDQYQMGTGYWAGILNAVPPPKESYLYLPMIGSPP